MTDRLLPVGATAIVRGVFQGRPWYEQAVRVLDSGASSVTSARWPGAATREISFYAQSLETGDRALREAARDALARGDLELVSSAWQWTGVVERVVSHRWFSVSQMFDSGGTLLCWYMNFQRPPVWRPDGWDTSDLALDLVIDPDGTRRWKDEDEYAHHLRLGLITDTEHAAVEAAREEAVALVEARGDMFAESAPQHWLPDPTWATPSLAKDTSHRLPRVGCGLRGDTSAFTCSGGARPPSARFCPGLGVLITDRSSSDRGRPGTQHGSQDPGSGHRERARARRGRPRGP